jgi:hypothetical protein
MRETIKTRQGDWIMRAQTIYNVCRKTASKRMSWASKIVKVEGGYMGFESVEDYRIWRQQK